MSELRTLQSLLETLPEPGDRPAVLALHKNEIERWSYAELDARARRLARGLAERGVERGDHVALLAPNRPEYIVASLGVVEAGAVVVPLDVQFDDEELGQVLDDSEARFIFTTSDQTDRLEQLDLEDTPEPILLDVGEDDERSWRCLLSEDGEAELPELEPDDPVALFYTSGTTGRAKGVPLSHGNLAFQLNTLLEADLVVEDDRVLLPLPLHHVYPFVIGMLTPLAAGLPIVIPRSLTGPQIVRALQEGEVSLIVGVPQLYEALYSGIEERSKSGSRLAATLFEAGVSLSTWLRRRLGLRLGKTLLRPVHKRFGPRLRVLASGGAPLDPEMALKLESLGWRVAIGYGLTETSPLLTLNPPDGAKLDSPGRPVSGVEIRIDTSAVSDDESEEQQQEQEENWTDEPHEEGEILARGPGVFAGYRNLPEETEEVLTDDGWYHTEDLGYFDDDGYLYVTGRANTLIVTESGKNIQPEDVEEVYLESSVISEVGVLQKDGRLVAVIVPELGEIRQREDGDVDEAIREAVDERSKQLPSYQQISDYAITRESLDYTQMGELRRHTLEERYNKAKEGEGDSDEAAGPISPEEMSEEDRNLLENPAAKEVWDLLAERYPDERLTPDTSPQLDLGVDSMEWINLSMEIGENAGVELDEEALERIDTVRDLLSEVAEGAETGEDAGASPLEQPEEVLSDEQKRWLEPLGPVMATIAWVLFALNWVVMRGLFRLRVEGLEHLPKEDPFVITPNHASYLDSFALAAALGYRRLRRTHWGGAGAAFSNPFNRFISRLAQAVPVEQAGVSSLAFGAAILEREKNLIWYPEGQRSPTGELQQFKAGIGMLLNHFRVPVVPVLIYGTHEAMPPRKALIRPKKITVVFGQPLDVDDLVAQGAGEEPQDRLVGALREHLAEMNDHS
jgi:long-chain acyl-CoA synthetase